jgi:hypothetical protein
LNHPTLPAVWLGMVASSSTPPAWSSAPTDRSTVPLAASSACDTSQRAAVTSAAPSTSSRDSEVARPDRPRRVSAPGPAPAPAPLEIHPAITCPSLGPAIDYSNSHSKHHNPRFLSYTPPCEERRLK